MNKPTEAKTIERLNQSWDANAACWSDAVRGGLLESRRLVTDQAIIDAVLSCEGRRVLDVGCGEGWLTRRLAHQGMDVVGFDGSAELIERARVSGGAAYHVVNYEEFRHQRTAVGRGYETAVSNFSILTEELQPLLCAIHGAVHTNGNLVIQTVHPAFLGEEPYVNGWREETFEALPGAWAKMPWYFRTIGSWVSELLTAGWQLKELREPLHPNTAKPASLILITQRTKR